MNVSVGQGVRRLPVYLLLDCSRSMIGSPIEAVKRGVEQFTFDVNNDPCAREAVHVAVITFASQAHNATDGLVAISQFQPPPLVANGKTALGQALTLLMQSLDKDVIPVRKGAQKGDWKPLVFILTDGKPTDDWEAPRRQVLERSNRKVFNIVTVGCGTELNDQNLREIGIGATIMLDSSDHSFREFFQWISQSVVAKSQPMTRPDESEDIPVRRDSPFYRAI